MHVSVESEAAILNHLLVDGSSVPDGYLGGELFFKEFPVVPLESVYQEDQDVIPSEGLDQVVILILDDNGEQVALLL